MSGPPIDHHCLSVATTHASLFEITTATRAFLIIIKFFTSPLLYVTRHRKSPSYLTGGQWWLEGEVAIKAECGYFSYSIHGNMHYRA